MHTRDRVNSQLTLSASTNLRTGSELYVMQLLQRTVANVHNYRIDMHVDDRLFQMSSDVIMHDDTDGVKSRINERFIL